MSTSASPSEPVRPGPDRAATVVVVGGGQAGLSAGYHLQRRGFASALEQPQADRSYVVLDAEPAPGGAWRHRWESLTMTTVNGIFDLPGFPAPAVDPDEPSRTAVPRYFAAFERHIALAVERPVRVLAVHRDDDDPDGDLVLRTSAGTWVSRALVNATGTWDNPLRPAYPGQETFAGVQVHTRDYVSAADSAGMRVAVVGAGISALQQLSEISEVAATRWYTRRPPVFRDDLLNDEANRVELVDHVAADVEAGRPIGSIVSYIGLAWTPYALAAQARGALERRPMFTAVDPDGVREADGSLTPLDAIVWATGFQPSLAHLDPLALRNEFGGIQVTGTQVTAEPRVHLVGYGPSQSTVGANRAGRRAVAALIRRLNGAPGPA
ncbi:NAD(P)-binding domain-containing protein [Geodermatophilus sp. URMC 62]|uniref:NAD(P)-binding domain-containing protein n=1 Tax=Geodermatophilus sp. URMC 62 TaxID=3423414 RepID=UPI00406D4153